MFSFFKLVFDADHKKHLKIRRTKCDRVIERERDRSSRGAIFELQQCCSLNQDVIATIFVMVRLLGIEASEYYAVRGNVTY